MEIQTTAVPADPTLCIKIDVKNKMAWKLQNALGTHVLLK